MPSRFVPRRRLTDEVTDTLREMILMGELEPSKKYTQNELADIVGVSTMPVREALLRLSHEGLVIAAPSRSYEIVRTTRSDIEDVYWLYAQLAGELTARACANATDELYDELVALNDRLLSLDNAPAETIENANWEFHRAINKAADAPRLVHALSRTVRLIPEYVFTVLPRWATVNKKDHVAILAAIEKRDPLAGRIAAMNHVLGTGKLVSSYFSDGTGTWDVPDGVEIGNPPAVPR